jgi:hypothetical protein
LDAFVTMAKTQPDKVFGRERDDPKRDVEAAERSFQYGLMLMVAYGTMTFLELREDRVAEISFPEKILRGAWRVVEDEVVVTWPDRFPNFVINQRTGKAFVQPASDPERRIPVKLAPRGRVLTSAELQGTWKVDVEASAAATKLVREQVKRLLPEDSTKGWDLSLEGLRKQIETNAMTIRIDGKEFSWTPVEAVKATHTGNVVIMGDSVQMMIRSPQNPDPELSPLCRLVADGPKLKFNRGGEHVFVFTKAPWTPDEAPMLGR